MGDHLCG